MPCRLLRTLAWLMVMTISFSACAPAATSSSQDSSLTSGASSGSASVQTESLPEDASAAPVAAIPEPKPKLTPRDIDEALSAVMEDYTAAAVSVATIEQGEVSQAGAWGWAVKDQREMTADTKLRVASISKVAIAMCAMAMAEDGLVDLDAPLSAYWGEGAVNPYSQTQPSIRTLMSHTSSLKDLEITWGLSRLQGIMNSSSSWRNMEPGDGGYWYYSNFGMCILGTTLELAADQMLDDYFQSRFCQPMGLRASFYGGNLPEEQLATLYNPGSVGRSAAAQANESVPSEIGIGASYYPGGLTISVVDLAKLISILTNKGVYQDTQYLSEESVAELETPLFSVDPGESSVFEQCLILRRQENLLGQDVLCYHTGSAYGVYALMSFNPETGNGVVVLTTGAPWSTDEYGLYSLCSDLSEDLYARMEDDVI